MAAIRKSSLKTQILPSEDEEQKGLVKWLTIKGILFYHIPNGCNKSIQSARRFKALGLQPGVPDICIPIPSGAGAALYIELKKKKGGVVSLNQRKWIHALREEGNCVFVANGADEAIDIITKYLASKY